MRRTLLAALAAAAVVGCSARPKNDSAMADSLDRDLQMAPADTGARLGDRPAATPARTTSPRSNTGIQSTTAKGQSLPAGSEIVATANSEISSKSNKAGETLDATVSQNVTDDQGRVVIPSGSTVKLTITQIEPAENKSQKDGKIVLVPATIMVNGQSYDLAASLDSVEHHLAGRGVTAGDAAKVGAGAAAGAIAGRVLSGNSKGAIIGGVVGAAVGTGVAVETADRDVVVPQGARIVLTLTQKLTL